ncbi:MAG: alpha-mannosidase, partial [Tissierella sp.]|uniref:alpha-mannosidase n=1 Tax=Tissierella sp. TaxID=41274 RepID=UPI003F9CFAAB
KIILRNQFHDIIPGTSIKEVYEDADREYAEAHDKIIKLNEDIKTNLSNSENKWTVFNTSAWNRRDIIDILLDSNVEGYFVDSFENKLKSIKTDSGYKVYIDSVPGFGTEIIEFVPENNSEIKEEEFIIDGNEIQTPYYIISWNKDGHLDKIYDKQFNRNVLKENQYGNVLQLFEDKPMNWDAWDIDIFYNLKKKNLKANEIEVTESNDLYTIVNFSYKFGKSKISQDMVLYSNSRRIDFKTFVDWNERQQLLKTAFELDIRSNEATYDIQYGNVKRPTHWNTSWDMAKFETVGHQWADLSETGYGVALMNDSKYGYDIKDNVMRLSLLKGPIFPDPESDIGKHEFVYSLLPHEGDYLQGKVADEAWSLNSPLRILEGEIKNTGQLIEVNSDSAVFVDAIKRTEDQNGLIIRLHDHTGGRRKISVNPLFEYKEWGEVNLMEKDYNRRSISSEEGINFILKPYEIKTLLIK